MTVPVLEIGGSHVTAALVDPGTGEVSHRTRHSLSKDAPAAVLLAALATAANTLPVTADTVWGAAIPGPFDYATGVARFANVGKFDSLNGVNVGAELRSRITPRPLGIRFTNDATAFARGEWRWGAAKDHARVVALTLGTGVGSAFLVNGTPVTSDPAVPPEGRADLLEINGVPLEDVVSTRAVLAAHGSCSSVAEIAQQAQSGDPVARSVLLTAYQALAEALAPWLSRFSPTAVVIGGGVSAAWDIVTRPLHATLGPDVVLVRSDDTEAAALRGALPQS
ncbi:MAG: ROK family protein [Kibdelosporangium sp.]